MREGPRHEVQGDREAVPRLETLRARAARRSSQGESDRLPRPAEKVAGAKQYMEAYPEATFGDLAKVAGLHKSSARRVSKQDPGFKPLRQVSTQRVEAADKTKRLEICTM